MFYTKYKCLLGELTLISDGVYLTGLLINESYNGNLKDSLPIFNNVKEWLDGYFNGLNPSINKLNLKPSGTKFQQEVWSITKEIPYGKTINYGDIAKRISNKMSSRAVGSALGKNPIPIIIPCHRVIGKSGKLTGYTGGLNIKIKLLELEGIKNYKL